MNAARRGARPVAAGRGPGAPTGSVCAATIAAVLLASAAARADPPAASLPPMTTPTPTTNDTPDAATAPDASPGALADADPPQLGVPAVAGQGAPAAPEGAGSGPQVRASPASLRLGLDRAAQLEIVGVDAASVDQLEVLVSVGTVRDITRAGPGRFTARYEPPATRAPDIALVVARRRGGAVAALGVVPLAGRYHLTLTVEPSARLSVAVGTLPPRAAVATSAGVVDLMLHVPPGIDHARIVATDRVGNATEMSEPLSLPPAHRVMLLPVSAPARVGDPVRWLVAAASADGVPASRAPDVVVEGARAEVAVPAGAPPGLFEVDARPQRQLGAATVTLRVREPGVAAVPPTLAVVVPATVPRTMSLRPPPSARAGETFVVPLTVRDAEGGDVAGLDGTLTATLGGRDPAHVELRDGRYVVAARAPEQRGAVEVAVRFAAPGASPLEARARVAVVAAPAARVLAPAPAPTLVIDAEQTVTLRALDRYGNPATVGHPSVQAAGAVVTGARAEPGLLRVALVARQPSVRLTVRGDYDLTDTVSLPAVPPVVRPFALGLVATARWNFGALGLFGGRVRFDAAVPLRPVRWLAFGAMVETGVEAGYVADAQMRSAQLITVPLLVRVGAWARSGRFSIGPFAGLGARFAQVDARQGDGSTARQTGASFALTASVIARVATAAGSLGVEVGVESGALDTTVARGTLGGIYGGLGWSLGF